LTFGAPSQHGADDQYAQPCAQNIEHNIVKIKVISVAGLHHELQEFVEHARETRHEEYRIISKVSG
jgi:hypothetical protein